MPTKVAFISVNQVASQDQPISIAVVHAEVEGRGPARIVAEHLSASMPVTAIIEALLSAQLVFSHAARSDAIYLAKLDRRVLQLDWRCSSTQWPGDNALSNIQELALSLGVNLHTDDNMLKSNALLLFEASTLHIGKTQRSNRYLDIIIWRGTWPVFSTLNPTTKLWADGISFSRVFPDTLTECSLTTYFQLWSRPEFDLIIGYPRLGFMIGGRLPSAFELEKSDNPNLAARVDADESLCLVSRCVIDDCFQLELKQSDYIRRPPPTEPA